MWNCPSELLVAIATHLPFPDKLTCTKVCRQWNSAIKNTILLQELEFSCPLKYTNFIEQVKCKQFNGSLVRKLILNTADFKWQSFRQVPILFPRLEEFIWPDSKYFQYMLYDPYDDDGEEEEEEEDEGLYNRLSVFQSWSQHLKKLDMFALQGFIPDLFDAVSLENITHLRLDYFGSTGAPFYYNNTIDALAEMPCLVSLDLTTFDIGYKFFERIHTNAPNLIQLGLYHFQIYGSDLEDMTDLTSIDYAVNLKALNLYNWCSLPGPNFFCLDYFAHKYPNLECVVMDCEIGGYNFFEDTEDNDSLAIDYRGFDVKMLNLLSICPIKKLGMLKQYMSPAILQKVETNRVDLTSISITTQPDFVCSIPASRILNSSHVYFLEKMSICQLDPTDWNYTLVMKCLKKLDLTCQGESISSLLLDLILIQCPSLEKINLTSTSITTAAATDATDAVYNENNDIATTTTVAHFHKLKKLKLKDVVLDDHVFSYISQYCPRLTSVHLESCQSITNVTNIYLPNHTLHQLSIWKHRGPYYCRVTTDYRENHYAIFGPPLALITRNLDEEFSTEKIEKTYCFDINFHCKSLTHLSVNYMNPY